MPAFVLALLFWIYLSSNCSSIILIMRIGDWGLVLFYRFCFFPNFLSYVYCYRHSIQDSFWWKCNAHNSHSCISTGSGPGFWAQRAQPWTTTFRLENITLSFYFIYSTGMTEIRSKYFWRISISLIFLSPHCYARGWRNVSQVFSSRCNFWLLTFINPIEINLCREILQLESNFQHISIGDNEMNSFPPTFSWDKALNHIFMATLKMFSTRCFVIFRLEFSFEYKW